MELAFIAFEKRTPKTWVEKNDKHICFWETHPWAVDWITDLVSWA